MNENRVDDFSDCYVQINENFGIVYAEETFYSFLGERSLYSMMRSVHQDDVSRMEKVIVELAAEKEKMISFRILDRKGRPLWVIAECKLESEKNGHLLIGLHINNIDHVRNGNSIDKKLKAQYETYLEIMGNVLLQYDPEQDVLKIYILNSQEIVFYQGALNEWKGKKLGFSSVDDDSVSSFEALCNAMKNRESSFKYDVKLSFLDDADIKRWYCFKGRTVKQADGKCLVMAVVLMVDLLTEESAQSSSVRYKIKDAGTELLNKSSITEYARRLIAPNQKKPVTLVIIDIDNFKILNDSYGHMFGDQVLNEVAGAIRDAVAHKGVCGRIGGDEMMVLLDGLRTAEEIRGVLRSIRNNVSWLYHDDPRNVKVTCSIGASNYPKDGTDYDTLFSIADKMLYLAKEKGRNRYIIYHKDLHEDYIHGRGSANKDEASFYKYRKTDVVNRIVNTYLQGKKEQYAQCSQIISLAFDVDSIFIYDLNRMERQSVFGEDSTTEGDIQYFLEDNYISDFTEEGIKVIDNVNFFERKAPALFRVYSALGYNQAIQYLLGGIQKEKNIIISFNRKKQGKKWASIDVGYLAILGNIIGMDYYNNVLNTEIN